MVADHDAATFECGVPGDVEVLAVDLRRGAEAGDGISAEVVDLRSESGEELARLDARFRSAVEEALVEERARWPMSSAPLTARWDTLGIRPGGVVAETSTIARMAVAAGKHVFCEKPVATNLREALDLNLAAK